MSEKKFTSKHDNFEIRKMTHKGCTYIQCKYISNFSELGTDYFSYNEELFKILRSVHVGLTSGYANSPGSARGRFRFYDSSAKKQVTIYASHLAYGCYHGLIKYNSLAADAARFKHYLSENELVVDHLNDNQHINTEYNLSVMVKTDNNRKRDIISKIQYPSACIVAYVQGKYRVRLFLRTDIKYFLQEYDASPERRAAIMSKTVPGGRPNYGQFEERYTCCNSNELLACLRREALFGYHIWHIYSSYLLARKRVSSSVCEIPNN